MIQGNDSKDDSRSWERMEAQAKKMQEMLNKDLEDLKKKQTKMNDTIKWNEKYSRRRAE